MNTQETYNGDHFKNNARMIEDYEYEIPDSSRITFGQLLSPLRKMRQYFRHRVQRAALSAFVWTPMAVNFLTLAVVVFIVSLFLEIPQTTLSPLQLGLWTCAILLIFSFVFAINAAKFATESEDTYRRDFIRAKSELNSQMNDLRDQAEAQMGRVMNMTRMDLSPLKFVKKSPLTSMAMAGAIGILLSGFTKRS